jgi:hypothetical protein
MLLRVMILSLLLLSLMTVMAASSESVIGEIVVVYEVSASGSVMTPGRPHIAVIVVEEDDELNALVLEGFDFDGNEVMSLCPVEAACARNPNVSTEEMDWEGNEMKESQKENNQRQVSKDGNDPPSCIEVIMMGGEEKCVVWKGRERKDGSSRRIVRSKMVKKL